MGFHDPTVQSPSLRDERSTSGRVSIMEMHICATVTVILLPVSPNKLPSPYLVATQLSLLFPGLAWKNEAWQMSVDA